MTLMWCCSVLECVGVCDGVWCSLLQCVAVCCSDSIFPPALFELNDSFEALQHVAVYCSMLQSVAVFCRAMQCVAVDSFVSTFPSAIFKIHDSSEVLRCVAVCCSVLQCVAVRCSVLQCVAVRCSVLQCVYLPTSPLWAPWLLWGGYRAAWLQHSDSFAAMDSGGWTHVSPTLQHHTAPHTPLCVCVYICTYKYIPICKNKHIYVYIYTYIKGGWMHVSQTPATSYRSTWKKRYVWLFFAATSYSSTHSCALP